MEKHKTCYNFIATTVHLFLRTSTQFEAFCQTSYANVMHHETKRFIEMSSRVILNYYTLMMVNILHNELLYIGFYESYPVCNVCNSKNLN